MEHVQKVSWKNTVFLNVNEAGTQSYTVLLWSDKRHNILFSHELKILHSQQDTCWIKQHFKTDRWHRDTSTNWYVNHTGAQLSQIKNTNKSGNSTHSAIGTFTYTWTSSTKCDQNRINSTDDNIIKTVLIVCLLRYLWNWTTCRISELVVKVCWTF